MGSDPEADKFMLEVRKHFEKEGAILTIKDGKKFPNRYIDYLYAMKAIERAYHHVKDSSESSKE